MPQPRRHKTNADRQRAYRERVATRKAVAAAQARSVLSTAERGPTPGQEALVARVLKAGSEGA